MSLVCSARRASAEGKTTQSHPTAQRILRRARPRDTSAAALHSCPPHSPHTCTAPPAEQPSGASSRQQKLAVGWLTAGSRIAASLCGDSLLRLRAEGTGESLWNIASRAEQLLKQLKSGREPKCHSIPDSDATSLRVRIHLVMQRQGRVQLEHPRLIRAQQPSWIPYQATVDAFRPLQPRS